MCVQWDNVQEVLSLTDPWFRTGNHEKPKEERKFLMASPPPLHVSVLTEEMGKYNEAREKLRKV